MNDSPINPFEKDPTFSPEQKEYLNGVMAGIAQRNQYPHGSNFLKPDSDSANGAGAEAAPNEPLIHGEPLSEVCKPELWKYELNGIDAWDKVLDYANANQFPGEADTFRLRAHGLFYVGPAEEAFMLRCRIPAGQLNSNQLRALAKIAAEYGNGKSAITTRSNLQIRGIEPKNLVNTLTTLSSAGLTSKGSGVDNVRNITASPTSGFDPQEFIDPRPYAQAVHHYILNNRDLYDLPRKFNIAFESGGAVETVADTNDIGFEACRIEDAKDVVKTSWDNKTTEPIAPGVYFRLALAGITGHKQFAFDTGLLLKPDDAVAVSAAMLRVFIANGDRTDRKKARLKYLIDKWGVEKFLDETQKRLSFPLWKAPMRPEWKRHAPKKSAQHGVHPQSQPGKFYVGVVVPVGILSVKQMRRIADLAENYGESDIRLTPWQNLLIPHIPEPYVSTVTKNLTRMGLHYETHCVSAGLVACTGNQGCKWASADTKGHAIKLSQYLSKRVELDQPINIHLTGCPHSCAQHYIGDIGLLAAKVKDEAGDSVEGYHITLGGGCADESGIGDQVFTGIPFSQTPRLIEQILNYYLNNRENNESFVSFIRARSIKEIQESISE